jgi:cyanophycinase-like exopeptidase
MRKLVLVGAGEFTPAMDETDTYLLSLLDSEGLPRRVAIVPTAAGQEPDYQKWIDAGIDHFTRLGAQPFGVLVLRPGDAEDAGLLAPLKDASFVYFSGGDPGYLCQALQCAPVGGSLLAQTVRHLYETGRIVAGCSAGALALGAYLPANAIQIFETGADPVYVPGMRLVGYTVFPHFDEASRDEPEALRRLLDGMPPGVRQAYLGIDANTALTLLDERQGRVFGAGALHLFHHGTERTYASGQSLLLPAP